MAESASCGERAAFKASFNLARIEGVVFYTTPVRGTRWLVEDYCDGSRLSVGQGTIDVRDFPARRTVRLRFRGRTLSYFARKVPLKAQR